MHRRSDGTEPLQVKIADFSHPPLKGGALGLRDRKETAVLQLICSVSLIARRSGFSRTRTTTRTTPQIRNLG